MEDHAEPDIAVWDENYMQFVWFRGLITQFRYAGVTATGLDYNVAYRELDDMQLAKSEMREWRAKMRIMERAALRHINTPS